MDIINHNSNAWDKKVEDGSVWTKAVSSEIIEKAKKGEWEMGVTAQKNIPKNWFPSLKGLKVLCLASGGGQQGPILAAVGAVIYTFKDNNNTNKGNRYEMISPNDTNIIIFDQETGRYWRKFIQPNGGSTEWTEETINFLNE